jgi:hypothetical protein
LFTIVSSPDGAVEKKRAVGPVHVEQCIAPEIEVKPAEMPQVAY